MSQTQRKQKISWDSAVATHPGLKRDNNEDRYHWDQEEGIFIVADGIGGYASGEVAATIAVETISDRLKKYGAGDTQLREAITTANQKIFEMAQAHQILQGMACVLTVAIIKDDTLFIGHVGDTRLYLLKPATNIPSSILHIEKITKDHSPIGRREDEEGLSEIEAMRHPRRNEVFRDVGSQIKDPDDEDFIDTNKSFFDKNSAVLLCSDGLTDLVTSHRIKEIIENTNNSQDAVNRLIIEALKEGGKDNITALLIANEQFYKTLEKIKKKHPEKFFYDFNIAASLANNWQDKLVTGLETGCQAYLEESKEIHQKYDLTESNSNSSTQEIFIQKDLQDLQDPQKTEKLSAQETDSKAEPSTNIIDTDITLSEDTSNSYSQSKRNPTIPLEKTEGIVETNGLLSSSSSSSSSKSKPFERSFINLKNITWLLICVSLLLAIIGGNKFYPEIREFFNKTPNVIPTKFSSAEPRKIIVTQSSTNSKKDELIFPTITSALKEAKSGETILVEPGEYNEEIVLKSGVNLTSKESYGAVIKVPIKNTTNSKQLSIAFLGNEVKDIVLDGFKIKEDAEHPLLTGVRLNKAQNIQLQNINISDTNTEISIEILDSQNITLVGNTINHNSGIGLMIKNSPSISLFHNEITENGYQRNEKPGIKIENSKNIKITGGLIGGNKAPEQIESLKNEKELKLNDVYIISDINVWKSFLKNKKSIPQSNLGSSAIEDKAKSKTSK